MNSKDLDEMQLARRNHIGNQSFMLLFYLLLLDIGLHGLGVEWLAYPLNVFLIMFGCMFHYLIRTILAGAYSGKERRDGKSKPRKTVAGALASFVACFATVVYMGTPGEKGVDRGGLLLFVLSASTLIVCIILMKWSERRNNRGDD